AIGLERSIGYLRQVGIDRIFDYDLGLGDRLIAGWHGLGAEIVSPTDRRARSPIVSARFPGREPKDVVRGLAAAGIVVSARRDVVRFSPHLYTTEADIDRALDRLAGLVPWPRGWPLEAPSQPGTPAWARGTVARRVRPMERLRSRRRRNSVLTGDGDRPLDGLEARGGVDLQDRRLRPQGRHDRAGGELRPLSQSGLQVRSDPDLGRRKA